MKNLRDTIIQRWIDFGWDKGSELIEDWIHEILQLEYGDHYLSYMSLMDHKVAYHKAAAYILACAGEAIPRHYSLKEVTGE